MQCPDGVVMKREFDFSCAVANGDEGVQGVGKAPVGSEGTDHTISIPRIVPVPLLKLPASTPMRWSRLT